MGGYPDANVALNVIGVDQCAAGIAAAIEGPDAPAVMHWSAPRPLRLPAVMEQLAQRGHGLVCALVTQLDKAGRQTQCLCDAVHAQLARLVLVAVEQASDKADIFLHY